MYERLPSVPLVRHALVPPVHTAALLVLYQNVAPFGALPVTVSHTRVVPASRRPQPAAQLSPPGMPPWNRLTGRTNDCWSPVHAPRLLVQAAPPCVQFRMQRLKPPLLLPSQKIF